MSLNESIVSPTRDAALEWFLLRSAPLNYVGQVGEQCHVASTLIPAFFQREKEKDGEVVLVGRLREAIRRPAAAEPTIPEDARAAIKRYLKTRFERRVNP
jgi:hypothetical protein